MTNSMFIFLSASVTNVLLAGLILVAAWLLGIGTNFIEVYLVLEFILAFVLLVLLVLPSADFH